jgi:hypothetical protein
MCVLQTPEHYRPVRSLQLCFKTLAALLVATFRVNLMVGWLDDTFPTLLDTIL